MSFKILLTEAVLSEKGQVSAVLTQTVIEFDGLQEANRAFDALQNAATLQNTFLTPKRVVKLY